MTRVLIIRDRDQDKRRERLRPNPQVRKAQEATAYAEREGLRRLVGWWKEGEEGRKDQIEMQNRPLHDASL